jgi:hypothetical protein
MKKFLLVILMIGILAAGFTAVQNDAAEWSVRDVEITVDLEDVILISGDLHMTVEEMVAALRDRGATAVGVREASILRYHQEGLLTVIPGSGIIHASRLTGEAHPALAELLEQNKIRRNGTYLLLEDRTLAERIISKLQDKLQNPVAVHLQQPFTVIELSESMGKVLDLRVGLDPRDIELLRNLGLRMVPRPNNMYLHSEKAVEEALAPFLAVEPEMLSAIVFEGSEVTGFPQYLEQTAARLNEAGVPFGIIEFSERQAGVERLSALTGYRTILVHPNQPNKTEQSIVTSVRERRVRVAYLRVPLTETNAAEKLLALTENVTTALAGQNYSGGPARPIQLPGHTPVAVLLMVLSTAAAATLLFTEILRAEPCPLWLVFVIISAGLLILFPLLSTNLALQAISLLAAVIFSVLAVVSQQYNRLPAIEMNNKSALLWALGTIIRSFIIVAAGGAIIVGLTSNPHFTGGTALFRGVKVVHILPLLLVVPLAFIRIYYHEVTKWNLPRTVLTVRELMSQSVRISYIAAFAVLAVAVFLYVGRTGHTGGLPVPGLELRLRALLDAALVVRPRFKEFLVGYPLAVLGLALVAKGSRTALTSALVAFSSIALISMANTFMHFTTPTPFTNALIRSFNGLWVGLLLGVIGYTVLCILLSIWEKTVKDV